MEAFLGIIIGILVTLIGVTFFRSLKKKQLAKTQSVLLIDKVKRVCKFITVEGDFAEIYHYEDVKQKFVKLISSKKKALVIVNAKAHVGFDLSKVTMDTDSNSKTMILSNFPQPEVLSIDTTINYYDKKDGYFNKFDASDLTELQVEAKTHIMDKIPESGLYDVAKTEALEAISLIENLVETIGWKLDYSALEIQNAKQKQIE
ncbi:MAG: DUF4230 domain-containing protein [Bacteroidia bacterium]|nr:DUF4230 domain-containing protein [Bacteroidia bacterium]MBT8279172.1 DUF4230 domain-containing protein [Bacteroidia bacterium]NND25549.1 DUF4230 domain-containing protein [Flavobacteriaceae bacterium]NNK60860.1 DUF4230 domain-containing protein [Flavobacteriaceae bacterium]RZW45110.1 MAG: DUF4230 domain-containing protein [Flavobacteriaceae bacterium]